MHPGSDASSVESIDSKPAGQVKKNMLSMNIHRNNLGVKELNGNDTADNSKLTTRKTSQPLYDYIRWEVDRGMGGWEGVHWHPN